MLLLFVTVVRVVVVAVPDAGVVCVVVDVMSVVVGCWLSLVSLLA